MNNQDILDSLEGTEIAIVGMACRFPGANNVGQYWQNLRDGVESVTFYTDEQLRAAGVPEGLLRNPHYVKSGAPLAGMEQFDAAFFGFGPRDAAIMDPQHRHFLECAWEALEHAGYDPKRFDGSIGVFGGSGHNAYMPYNLLTNPDLVNSVGFFLLRHTGNDKDFLTTRVSYVFDLKGPSVNVQTACSTSLVAMHMASQSLLNRECDMALAGGVTLELPHNQGYLYHEGEILSPDGHCRAFDAQSEGTIFGSGVGILVLKRLADAIEAGDTVHAVLRASAINNDGSGKVNYLAPSVDGQASAIAEAIALAGITADSITYVEAHGTGTRIGDPIEVTALTQAFRATTDKKLFCGLGSVKTNIGHLDTAAGVASAIKVIQALKHKQIPPTLNWTAPNPMIEFSSSPFYVNIKLRDWNPPPGIPRRAGVSSLGVGGTNAHIILEEAPEVEPSSQSPRPWLLLPLSAKTNTALDKMTANLAAHLRQNPETNLADVAYTLQVGRQGFTHRRFVVCQNTADLIETLESGDRKRLPTQTASDNASSVAFMFPGGGAQYPNMGRDLYETEPVYREQIDTCLKSLRLILKADLKSLMFPPEGADLEAIATELQKPSLALPALFMTEYALAKLWMSWGIEPTAMTGHSMGEYTAACLAGVFSVQDALAIVTWRGQLFETLPNGGMISVQLPEAQVKPLLLPGLDIAAINAPELCAISGSIEAIDQMEQVLAAKGIEARRIKIDVAAHSQMLEPILEEFGRRLATKIRFNQPTLRFISNVTGTWAKAEEVTKPEYWVRHLRQTVRFADGMGTLMKDDPNRAFLEVGPGTTMASLARMHPEKGRNQNIINAMRHVKEEVNDVAFVLGALGRLWQANVPVAWANFYGGELRHRVPLPTYPFDHQRYWIEPGKQLFTTAESARPVLAKMPDLADWFYKPVWKTANLQSRLSDDPVKWLVFKDRLGLAERVVEQLAAAGHEVITVVVGEHFKRLAPNAYAINPRARIDYDTLVEELGQRELLPQQVAHFWLVNHREKDENRTGVYHRNQDLGYYSLFFLAQCLAEAGHSAPLHITAVSNGTQKVRDEAVLYPEKAPVLGPVKVIPSEMPHITCQLVDITVPDVGKLALRRGDEPLLTQLMGELAAKTADFVVAYRGNERWVQSYEPTKVAEPSATSKLRPNGTYLITGGLGGIGLVMAEHLAKTLRANLVLIGRSAMPARSDWDNWLNTHSPGDKTSRQIRKVRELEAMGAQVLAISADVMNREQMTTAVSQARKQFGTIHGVIHAAGVLNDNLIQLKTADESDKVLNPKIRGTLLLDELLQDVKLDFFILFSSTSTILGQVGQVDYVGANAFLNAFAESKQSPYTVALNWGVWQEVGMAMDAAKRLGLIESHEPQGVPVAHPLLETRIVDTPDEIVYAAEYTVQKHWLLDQHRLKGGHALIPGTGYLEIAKAALENGNGAVAELPQTGRLKLKGPIEIRDLFFIAPLEVLDNETKEVQVSLENDGVEYEFVVKSKTADNSSSWQEHARGKVGNGRLTTARLYNIEEIMAVCNLKEVKFGPKQQETRQETYLDFGPRWKNVRQMNFGKNEAIATLELPEEFTADLKAYQLHPSLVDLATGFALPLIEGYESSDDFYVPLSYKQVRINAPLPRKIYSYARLRVDGSTSKEVPMFDVTILDEYGRILVDIHEFMMKKVSPDTMISGSQRGATGKSGTKSAQKTADGEPSLLQLAITDGIAPAEGTDALNRILSHQVPPVTVVTSLNLDALLATLKKDKEKSEDSAGFKISRPNVSSTFEAPRTEIEKTLARFWQELLGVEEVGIHDDFFELGGHSLIAVRLFNKVKKTFSVDFSLATLFEAPTIAQFAELLKAEVGEVAAPVGEGEKKTAVVRPTKRAGWSSLVAIQPKGSKPPFFCVHGALGNVLNFYDLTRYLGPDQPFYGLQAQGVDGKRPAFESMEEMATTYLKEVRAVQPRGPYFLGGFSLGGEVAIVMAQQLMADGEQVALVALLDTLEPERSRPTERFRGILRFAKTRSSRLQYIRRWIDVKSRLLKWRLRLIYLNGSYQFRLRTGREIPQSLIGPYLWESHNQLLDNYTHQPYTGDVVLFRASKTQDAMYIPPAVTWESLVKGHLDIHVIQGTHNIVKEPYVAELAKLLQAALADAQNSIPTE